MIILFKENRKLILPIHKNNVCQVKPIINIFFQFYKQVIAK